MSAFVDVLPAGSLTEHQLNQMWNLFHLYYYGSDPDTFREDVLGKHTVLLVKQNGNLVGFNSLKICQVGEHRCLYSGDLLMAREGRGAASILFFRAWAEQIWDKCDWWCLLTSGQRTFRMPHLWFKRITPMADGEETLREARFRHQFASAEYGERYDPETGIVRLASPYVVRPEQHLLRKGYPMEEEFETRNPAWEEGDEVVQLVSLQPDNWKPWAIRKLQTVPV